MNTSSIFTGLSRLRAIEEKAGLLLQLEIVRDALKHYVATPKNSDLFTAVQETLSTLESHQKSTLEHIGRTEREILVSSDNYSIFDPDVTRRVLERFVETPDDASFLITTYDYQIKKIRLFRKNSELMLNALTLWGFVEPEEASQAGIGFTFPRAKFSSDMDSFITELKEVRTLVRLFGEIASGDTEEPMVGELSSSDPTVVILQSIPVLILFGSTVSWALNQWKKIEEIRRVRAEATRLEGFSEQEIADLFDQKITDLLEQEIEKKVQETIEQSAAAAPRKKELENGLRLSLRKLLDQIDDGLIVHLQVPHLSDPPPSGSKSESKSGGGAIAISEKEWESLRAINFELNTLLSAPGSVDPQRQLKDSSEELKGS